MWKPKLLPALWSWIPGIIAKRDTVLQIDFNMILVPIQASTLESALISFRRSFQPSGAQG